MSRSHLTRLHSHRHGHSAMLGVYSAHSDRRIGWAGRAGLRQRTSKHLEFPHVRANAPGHEQPVNVPSIPRSVSSWQCGLPRHRSPRSITLFRAYVKSRGDVWSPSMNPPRHAGIDSPLVIC